MRRGFNKYNVSPKADRTADGIVFDSKWEMTAYCMLLESLGKQYIELSPKYELQPKFRDMHGKAIRAIIYIGDFLVTYRGKVYLIDTKGFETDVFKMKEKMFKFKYPKLEILKIKSKKKMNELIERIKKSE